MNILAIIRDSMRAREECTAAVERLIKTLNDNTDTIRGNKGTTEAISVVE